MKKSLPLIFITLILLSSCNKNVRSALKMPGADNYSSPLYNTKVRANDFSNDFYKTCAYGSVKEVQKLVKEGASVNAIDDAGYSPLFYAVLGGNPSAYNECVQKFIAALKVDKDEDVYAALDCVPPVQSNTKVVEYLLKNGANVQLKDRNERPVFVYAALFCNDSKILKSLKDAGADIHSKITVQYPSSLLSIACMTNPNADVIDFLCKEGGNIDEQNKFGTTPIMWAAMYTSNPAVIDVLIKNGADINDPRHKDGYSPLIWSVRCNRRASITEHLCKLGADVSRTDNYDWHALDWALLNSPSFKWNEKFKRIENRLVDYDTLEGLKAYSSLKERGKAEYLSALLKYCNDDELKINALNSAVFSSDENFIALVNSIKSIKKIAESDDLLGVYLLAIAFDDVQKLKCLNSKTEAKDEETFSLEFYYSILTQSKKCAEYLAANVSEMDMNLQTNIMTHCTDGEILQIFLKASFIDVYRKDSEGKTLLYTACGENNYSAVTLLIEKGADVNTTCSFQKSRTPLIAQCYKTYPNSKIVSLLLQHGARVNAKDEDGVSALIAACYSNKNDTAIKILLNYGADKTEKYKDSYPYQYCNSTIKNSYYSTYQTLYNATRSYSEYWWD